MKIRVKRGVVRNNSITMLPNSKRKDSTPRNVVVMNSFAVTIFIRHGKTGGSGQSGCGSNGSWVESG